MENIPCFKRVLYNYVCILIGCCPWSIRGHTHRLRQGGGGGGELGTLKQARTATVVNKQLNFNVKKTVLKLLLNAFSQLPVSRVRYFDSTI